MLLLRRVLINRGEGIGNDRGNKDETIAAEFFGTNKEDEKNRGCRHIDGVNACASATKMSKTKNRSNLFILRNEIKMEKNKTKDQQLDKSHMVYRKEKERK